MGPYADQLLQTVEALAPGGNPYDLAVEIQDYLRGPHFSYSTDVRSIDCGSRSAVECFAQFRQGYCLHYASTMAILLRAADPANPIPTRLVQGFLPSTIIGGTETVLNKQAHAWVEVFFPGYGWIPFDPTGGGDRPADADHGRSGCPGLLRVARAAEPRLRLAAPVAPPERPAVAAAARAAPAPGRPSPPTARRRS